MQNYRPFKIFESDVLQKRCCRMPRMPSKSFEPEVPIPGAAHRGGLGRSHSDG